MARKESAVARKLVAFRNEALEDDGKYQGMEMGIADSLNRVLEQLRALRWVGRGFQRSQ